MSSSFETIERTITRVKGFSIGINISLTDKDKNGRRINSILVREYQTRKYSEPLVVDSINITCNNYLTFNYLGNEISERASVYISYPQLEKFIKFFKKIKKWFNSNIFKEKTDGLHINKKYKKLLIELNNLPGNKTISAFPDLLKNKNDEILKGVTFHFYRENLYGSLSEEDFLIIYYCLKKVDLFLYSQSLINFALIMDSHLDCIFVNEENDVDFKSTSPIKRYTNSITYKRKKKKK